MKRVLLVSMFALVLGANFAFADPRSEMECMQKVNSGAVEWVDGNTRWMPVNAQRLCMGTSVANAPVACFMALLPGCQVQYAPGMPGQNCAWQWENAVNLCGGANNAFARLSCFSTLVQTGMPWQMAINHCRTL